MFQHPFSFEGRIGRAEFAISYVIYLVGLVVVVRSGDGLPEGIGLILTLAFFIPGLWFLWAQGAKRCHDRGNPGWYQIIPFYRLWMLFAPGERGINEYDLPAAFDEDAKRLEDNLIIKES